MCLFEAYFRYAAVSASGRRIWSSFAPVTVGALVFVLFFKGFTNLSALLYLIPGIILLFLLAWSGAILSGILFTYFRDAMHLQEVGFQVLFYGTPILYPPGTFAGRGRIGGSRRR